MDEQLNTEAIAANITRLRNQRGWSKTEASDLADIGYRTYLKLEQAKTNPQLDTLRKLAQAFDVRIADLLEPVRRLESARFRANKEGMKKRDDILAQVSLWLDGYNELLDLLGEQDVQPFVEWLRDFNPPGEFENARERGEFAASEVRRHLDLTETEPIRDICGLLSSNGIKLYPYQSATDAFFGLSVGEEDGGPAVVVNTNPQISVERWIFTAAHELGHIVLHKDSFDREEILEDDAEEADANWFASAFLMPDEIFRKEWQQTEGVGFIHRVFKLKRMFGVSYQTVLRRLIENRTEGDYHSNRTRVYELWAYSYERFFGTTISSKKFEPEPLAPSAFSEVARSNEPDQLSEMHFVEEGYRSLVRRAFDQELISLSKVSEYLQLPLSEARELVNEWHREKDLGF
ncbi:MAG: helix-turn-helix domain-containing protein [Myxococcota bacterium]